MAFKTTPKGWISPKYARIRINKMSDYSRAIPMIAGEIVNRNLSTHRRKTIDYLDNGITNIKTLAKVLHLNHSTEIHDSIMNSHTDISYVNLYYGKKEVRIESNGSIMAIVLYCRNIPRLISPFKGWKSVVGNNKIVLYTEGDNLISGDISLFSYNTSLRVYRAEVIGAKEESYYATINIEGVDYWEYLKGNWETMDSVHWENYKATF